MIRRYGFGHTRRCARLCVRLRLRAYDGRSLKETLLDECADNVRRGFQFWLRTWRWNLLIKAKKLEVMIRHGFLGLCLTTVDMSCSKGFVSLLLKALSFEL